MATPETQNTAAGYPSSNRQIYKNLPEVGAMRAMSPGDKAAFIDRLGQMDTLREKIEKTMSPEQKAAREQMFGAIRKMDDPGFAALSDKDKKSLADQRNQATNQFANSLSPEQKTMMDQLSDMRRANPVAQGATPTTRPPSYNAQVAGFVAGLSPEQYALMDRLQQSNARTLPEAEKDFKDLLRPEQQQGFADFQKLQLRRHGVHLDGPAPAPVTAAPVVPAPPAAPAAIPPAAPAGPQASAVAAVTLHPQQQQAYLKSLGYEVGSLNDTAKNKDQIEAAQRKFAVDNKIDPNDKAAVTKALQDKAMAGAATKIEGTQFAVAAGKYSPDDVKTTQWLMKGQGRDMPKSTRADGTVDGIPGAETKTAMPETVTRLKAEAAKASPASSSRVAAPAGDPSAQGKTFAQDAADRKASASPSIFRPSTTGDIMPGPKEMDPQPWRDFVAKPAGTSGDNPVGLKDTYPSRTSDLPGAPASISPDQIKDILSKHTLERAGSVSLQQPDAPLPGNPAGPQVQEKPTVADVMKMGRI